METGILHDYGAVLENLLRLKTSGLAVKLLKEEDDIPEGAKKPTRDFGYHLSLCQAFAKSRREGIPVAMFMDDMWCFEPVVGLGFARAPQYFLEGNNRFPGTARTQEAGRNWAQSFPHFEYNTYKAIVSAPLRSVNFSPDVIILYCDPAQLTQLLIAVNWIDGNDITCRLSGHAGCVYSIVPVMQNNQFQVTSPCIGDRKRALAQDTELIFSFPTEKIVNLAAGLEALEQDNAGMPVKFQQMPEYELEESYAKIGRMIGLKIPD